jgi:hypothetical protein
LRACAVGRRDAGRFRRAVARLVRCYERVALARAAALADRLRGWKQAALPWWPAEGICPCPVCGTGRLAWSARGAGRRTRAGGTCTTEGCIQWLD